MPASTCVRWYLPVSELWQWKMFLFRPCVTSLPVSLLAQAPLRTLRSGNSASSRRCVHDCRENRIHVMRLNVAFMCTCFVLKRKAWSSRINVSRPWLFSLGSSLGCGAVNSYVWITRFRRNMIPPSSGSKRKRWGWDQVCREIARKEDIIQVRGRLWIGQETEPGAFVSNWPTVSESTRLNS
jgi:hypothetical protein